MKRIKGQGWRISSLLLVVVSVISAASAYFYLTTVCSDVNSCSYVMRNAFLRPTIVLFSIWAAMLTPFIFLPQHYFKAYFKNLFWWSFLLAVLVVYARDPNNPNFLVSSAELSARNQSIVWGIMTALYVAYHWWQKRHSRSSHFRWWFLLPLVLIFFINPYLFA